MGLVAYNPSDTTVTIPEGFHLPASWRFYEDENSILNFLINGPLVRVDVPPQGTPVSPEAQAAFDAYWAVQPVEDLRTEDEKEADRNAAESRVSVPETPAPRRKGSKVRDTSNEPNDSASDKEA